MDQKAIVQQQVLFTSQGIFKPEYDSRCYTTNLNTGVGSVDQEKNYVCNIAKSENPEKCVNCNVYDGVV